MMKPVFRAPAVNGDASKCAYSDTLTATKEQGGQVEHPEWWECFAGTLREGKVLDIHIGGEREIHTGAVRYFAVAGNDLVDVTAAELRELGANALAAADELDALTGAG
jgi:hypothetical protein